MCNSPIRYLSRRPGLLAAGFSLAAPLAYAQSPSTSNNLGQTPTFDRGAILLPKNWEDAATLTQFRTIKDAVGGAGVGAIEVLSPPGNWATSAFGTATLSVPGSTMSIEAAAVSSDRVVARTRNITNRMLSEPQSERSALSDLVRQFQPLRVPTVSVAQPAADIMFARGGPPPFERVDATAEGGTLGANGSVGAAIERARSLGIMVHERHIQKLPSAERVAAATSSRADQFAAQYGRTVEALGTILKNPGQDSLKAFRDQAAATRKALIDNWMTLSKDPAARRQAVQALSALELQPELKATYGVPTNFSPPSYRQVYLDSRRVVAVRAGGMNICSGMLLDDAWIMTAGHCFKGRDWADLRIVLGKDGFAFAKLEAKIVDLWPSPPPGQQQTDHIDYAFARISDSDFRAVIRGIDEQVAQVGGGPPELGPLCIKSEPLSLREPVYVIAQRLDDKKVHDHAYVRFPYKLSEENLAMVIAENGIELTRIAERLSNDASLRKTFIEGGEALLRDAYTKVTLADGRVHYEFRTTGSDFVQPRPFFGVDTDTFHGNSGGPVFSRNNTCIVGIFSGGAPDNFSDAAATSRQHEFVTPIAEVLLDLRRAAAGLDEAAQDDVNANRRALLDTLNRLEKQVR